MRGWAIVRGESGLAESIELMAFVRGWAEVRGGGIGAYALVLIERSMNGC